MFVTSVMIPDLSYGSRRFHWRYWSTWRRIYLRHLSVYKWPHDRSRSSVFSTISKRALQRTGFRPATGELHMAEIRLIIRKCAPSRAVRKQVISRTFPSMHATSCNFETVDWSHIVTIYTRMHPRTIPQALTDALRFLHDLSLILLEKFVILDQKTAVHYHAFDVSASA